MSKKRASIKDNNPLESNKRQPRQRTRKQKDSVVRTKPKQTTFLIYKDQLDWLEQICFNASRKGGKKMSKAYVLRALIDVAKEHDLSLEGVTSEEEVKEKVADLFTKQS